MDAELGSRAIDVFGSVDGAAEWLIGAAPDALNGRAPVEVATTARGRQRILQALSAIEHGMVM